MMQAIRATAREVSIARIFACERLHDDAGGERNGWSVAVSFAMAIALPSSTEDRRWTSAEQPKLGERST